MGVKKRLKDLEGKVLQPIEWGSTRISYADLPEAEQALYDKVWKIIDAHQYNNTADLQPWELKLMDQASRTLWCRAIDLFNNAIGGTIHHDNPTGKMLWNMWFGFFMHEMCEAIPQRIAEDEIFSQKGKSWKKKEAEAAELYKNWVKPFSEERLSAYIDRMLSHKPKTTKIKRKKKVKNRESPFRLH